MSNQETNQEQIQFPAQQELKHLRTRCGKVYALGNNRFRAVVQTTPVHEYDAATHQWVELSAEKRQQMAAQAHSPIAMLADNSADSAVGILDTYVKEGSTQNFSHDERLWISNTNYYGNRLTYLKVVDLPRLGANHFITSAKLCVRNVYAPTADTAIMCKEVLKDWDPETITYATQPKVNSLYQDYCRVLKNQYSWKEFDVTSLARKARDIELFPRILIFQHAAVVLIQAVDFGLGCVSNRLRIPVLQHFLAHDGGVRRRCIDVANAQLCGRDEVVRAQTRQVHNLQVGQTVAVVIRVADPQPLVVRKVLRRTFLNVGIEDAHGRIRRIIREHRNRAVCLRRHLLALLGGKFHPLVRRRVVLMNRRGLHHCPESVVAQRVHLAASGAQVFQFLLSRELNLFLIGFLVTHMFPFFSVRSFRARFFLSDDTKKPLAPCAGASLYLSMV